MRHRRRGRKLGRSPSHRRAMLRNLASSLFLTERDAAFDDNEPKVKGRVVTTLAKAKEVRPLVEKCITIARNSLRHAKDAEQYATEAERGSEEWRQWRGSDDWRKWAEARAPVVYAQRRCIGLLGDKQAVSVLFDTVAPRFEERPGGYTRVLKLADPRLGDAGNRAILEFVGVHDRVVEHAEKPAFEDEEPAAGASAPAEEEGQQPEGGEQAVATEEEPQAEGGEQQAEERGGEEEKKSE